MQVTYLHDRAEQLVGLIPGFLSDEDPRPAAEQFDEAYAHGGGWRPMPGWTYTRGTIRYPGDEVALHPIAKIILRDEQIFIYPSAWVAIVQRNGDFAVSWMD